MRLVKKIIKKLYHLIWFLSVILFIPNVNALTTVDGAKFTQPPYVAFADNTGGHLTRIDSTFESLGSYYRSNDSILTNGADTGGANWAFYSDTPLVQGHTYALSVLIGMANTYAIVNSTSRARLCIAEDITNAFTRYNNYNFPCTTTWAISTNNVASYTDNNLTQFYTLLSYVFTADFTSNALTGSYNSAQSNQSNHTFGGYILEEISSQPLTSSQIQSAVQSSGLATANSVSQVQSSINQIQTDINSSSNNIINNNNNNTNNIINNNNQNTDEIINNNNENTDKEIESQKVCTTKELTYSDTIVPGSYLSSSGSFVSSSVWGVTDYLEVNKITVLTSANYGSGINSCFYDSNKNLLSCIDSTTSPGIINIPNNTKFARFSIRNNDVPKYRVEYCSNGNQVISDNLGDLNSNITDDTAPDVDLDLSVSSDTPISDLITMPLTILNSLVNSLDGTCTNYTIPFLFDSTVTFPCFTISDYLGNNVTNYIDLFICLYMCYNIGMLVVSIFEDITSLRDIYDGLYTPQHAYTGYQPKHAKGSE